MSENEFDVHRGNEKDARDNVVLTGEEIELPGDGSDAAAIIGEASEPINTGEIESVAIGGLTGRAAQAHDRGQDFHGRAARRLRAERSLRRGRLRFRFRG